MPPSATYRKPSGPNFNPRGLFKPVAKTVGLGWAGSAGVSVNAIMAGRRNFFAILEMLMGDSSDLDDPAALSHCPRPCAIHSATPADHSQITAHIIEITRFSFGRP